MIDTEEPMPPLTRWESAGICIFLDSLMNALTYVHAGGAYLAVFRAAQCSIDALVDVGIMLDSRIADLSRSE